MSTGRPSGADASSPDPVVELKGVEHDYGGGPVLCGIDLRVRPGEILGYLGPNGAGKSTTIKILTGQLRPTAGEVRVLGIDVLAEPVEVRRRIAYVPEVSPLYEVLSAREHLALVGRLRDLDEEQIRRRTEELLEALELAAVGDRPLWTFSRGMRQRVALASAFLHGPDLVLLDEPLYGLDVQTVLLVKEVVRRLAAAGVAVLYSSHLLDVVEQLASRVVILADGKIRADGPPAVLREQGTGASLEGLFRELTAERQVEDRARAFLRASGLGSTPAPETTEPS